MLRISLPNRVKHNCQVIFVFTIRKKVKDLYIDSLEESVQKQHFEQALKKRKDVRARFQEEMRNYEQEKLAFKLQKSRNSQQASQDRSRRKTD